eukprot:359650-Chlamydomonas_euryale.AAC.7
MGLDRWRRRRGAARDRALSVASPGSHLGECGCGRTPEDACTVSGMKQGGQTLVGGLDISVSRNFFGAQINSFETQLAAPEEFKKYGG